MLPGLSVERDRPCLANTAMGLPGELSHEAVEAAPLLWGLSKTLPCKLTHFYQSSSSRVNTSICYSVRAVVC